MYKDLRFDEDAIESLDVDLGETVRAVPLHQHQDSPRVPGDDSVTARFNNLVDSSGTTDLGLTAHIVKGAMQEVILYLWTASGFSIEPCFLTGHVCASCTG